MIKLGVGVAVGAAVRVGLGVLVGLVVFVGSAVLVAVGVSEAAAVAVASTVAVTSGVSVGVGVGMLSSFSMTANRFSKSSWRWIIFEMAAARLSSVIFPRSAQIGYNQNNQYQGKNNDDRLSLHCDVPPAESDTWPMVRGNPCSPP